MDAKGTQSGEFSLHFPLKLLPRQLTSFVQPGYTSEMRVVPPR